jgi:tetratricopeptide (TPR) repeat protein
MPVPKGPTVAEQIHEAARAAHAGQDEQALRRLRAVAAEPNLGDLPDTLEEVLADLGGTDTIAPGVRAEAWAVFALSRERHGDDLATMRALNDAFKLAPTPARLGLLASVTARVDGPAAAWQLLETGLDRWPDDAVIRVWAAAFALDTSDLHQARELTDQALQRDPGNTDARIILARLELVQDRPEAAIEPAREIVPDKPSLGRALLAIAFNQSGRLSEDPGLIDAVLAEPPTDIWVLTQFAQVLLANRRPHDARQVLDRTLALAPGAVEALRVRGFTLTVLGDYPAAAADLDQAALIGDDPWLTSMRGEVARLRGDAATAAELFGSLDEDEEPVWVASSLGLALVALGDIEGAREAYVRALRRHADDVNALCGLGEIEFEFGGEDGTARGETLLQQALQLEPNDPRANALLAEVYRRTGRLQEAVTGFNRALSVSPGYSYALASKGQTLVALDDPAGGIALLVQAAKGAPTTAWILDELIAALEAHEPEKADVILRNLQRQVQDAGGDILPLCAHRARRAFRLERWAEAEHLYRKARELAPADAGLAKDQISVLQQLDRAEEAVTVLDEVAAALPNDQELKWQRIGLLWELGRLSEVRTELELLNQGEDPPALVKAALGETYRMEGRIDKARRLLNQALQRDPDSAYTHASLGALELDHNQPNLARLHLRRATELQQGYGFALSKLVSLELDEGHAEAVADLLHQMQAVAPADRYIARVRAQALYGLGEYMAALRVLDECLVEAGSDAQVLRARGWVEVALGQSQRAAHSFLSSASLPNSPPALLDLVDSLTRVDRWSDALHLVTRGKEKGNPFVDTAVAVLWLHAGAWKAAAAHAVPGYKRLPQSQASGLLVAARSLRVTDMSHDAVELAREALRQSPMDLDSKAELAECLLREGNTDEAKKMFEELLRQLERRVHLDADGLNLQGWCLLRLGRIAESGKVFLRALSATDRTANVLLNLVYVSLLDGDLRQTRSLINRAREELEHLSSPTRRGLLAAAIQDLTTITPHLASAPRSEATRLAAELGAQQTALDPKVQEASASAPFGPG